MIGQPTRMVIGLLYFLLTIISILLGASYPFWIIPGLVILFVTGLGPPGSAPAIVIVRNHTKSTGTGLRDPYQNNNNTHRGGGTDQDRMLIDDQMIHNSPIAVFNHLMR